MTRKKPAFLRSCIVSACMALSMAGLSSYAWSADEEDNAASSSYDYSQRASEVAIQAMSVVDAQYRYGGNAPATGVDCSGLVRYVYKQAWGAELPRTAAAISAVGEKINTAELQPGDLVFYNTRRRKFSHVGIYLGDNKFVHAPSRGGKVRVDDMGGSYWQARFNGARRIVDPQKEKMETEQILQAFRDEAESKPKNLARSR